jgi:hypothetical protein
MLAVGLAGLCMVTAIAFITWRWADDFSNALSLRHSSIVGLMINNYIKWDGRSLTLGSFIQFAMIKYLPVWLCNLFWTTCFVFAAFFVYKIIRLEVNARSLESPILSWIQFLLVVFMFWLGMGFHISETVYWETGGIYSFNLLTAFAWLFLQVWLPGRVEVLEKPFPRVLLFFANFLFGIIAGMSAQNLSPALLLAGVFIIVVRSVNTGKFGSSCFFILAGLVGIAVGTAILYAAPGNFGRARFGADSLSLNLSVLLKRNLLSVARYLYWSCPILITSMLAGFLFASYRAMGRYPIKFFKVLHVTVDKKLLLRLLDKFKWLIAAVATYLPFTVLPDFVAPRTTIFFAVFLSIFIIETGTSICTYIFFDTSHEAKSVQKLNPIALVFLAVIFISQLLLASSQLFLGLETLNKIGQREKYFLTERVKGQDVEMPAIAVPKLLYVLRLMDVTNDPSHWINRSVSDYYELKSIRLKE